MLNLGFGEIALIVALAIVVVGPDRLPEMLRFLGKQYGRLMRASNELRRAFMIEADRDEAARRADALRQRREQARKRAEEARNRAMERAKLTEAGEPVPRTGPLSDDPEATPDPSRPEWQAPAPAPPAKTSPPADEEAPQ